MHESKDSENANTVGREALEAWKKEISHNGYTNDGDIRHSVTYHLKDRYDQIDQELEEFAHIIHNEVEPLVAENNRQENLSRVAGYDGIGNKIEMIIHHPTYAASGNLIYGSRMLERMARPGGLTEGL